MNYRLAIVKRWRQYGLPHVACGFVNQAEIEAKGAATMTFGDGSWIEIQDAADIIVTDIPCEAIEE